MRLAWLVGAAATVVALGVVACSPASGPNNGADAGEPEGGTFSDAAVPDAAQADHEIPSLVFIDGLVTGSATSTSNQAIQLDDVRVCIHDQSAPESTFITPHALPFDRALPLANYPGLQRGSGIDLGSITAAVVDIDVYSAFDLRNDAAWAPDSSELCSKAYCSGNGPPCIPHVRVSVTLSPDVTVVALVDDAANNGVKVRTASFEDKTFNGASDSLSGTVVDLSDWHDGAQIAAFYGNPVDGSGIADVNIANPLAKDTAASPGQITASIASYETLGIRFDQFSGQQPFDRFGQSLDSIAYVADPTVTPPVFYGVRENFVFALVGDPNDPTSVNDLGGRNPQFNRKGLHIAAVPYATPRPKP